MKKLSIMTMVLVAAAFAVAGCASGYDADGATVSTNPDAEGGVDYAPVVIGEITAMEDDAVTLQTATGSQVIQLMPTTTGEEAFDVGDTVAVDVNRTEAGVSVAATVRRPSEEELEGAGLADPDDMEGSGSR